MEFPFHYPEDGDTIYLDSENDDLTLHWEVCADPSGDTWAVHNGWGTGTTYSHAGNCDLNSGSDPVESFSHTIPHADSANHGWDWGENDFSVIFKSDDSGDNYNSVTQTYTIQQSADFGITITGDNEPVTEGGTWTAFVDVTNNGDETATQTIEMEVSGITEDTEDVTLTGGETKSISLDWSTSSGDNGNHDVVVYGSDDSDTTTATIDEDLDPANFQVSITETNSPIYETQTLEVTADIQNTGDESDTQTIILDFIDPSCDSTSVSLNGGSSTTETLTCSTEDGDAGTHTATVSSNDDSDSTSATVDENPMTLSEFNPADGDTDVSVDTGLGVDVYHDNNTDIRLEYFLNGDSVGCIPPDCSSFTDSGNRYVKDLGDSLNYSTAYDWHVEVEDTDGITKTSSTQTFTTESDPDPDNPANFTVDITSFDWEVTEGDTATFTADIENTGDKSGTQTVELYYEDDNSVVDSTSVTLDGGQSTTETFSYTTQEGDAGTRQFTVRSDNSSDTVGVTINAPAEFNVSILYTNDPVTEGEQLVVETQVENVGDEPGVQDVDLVFNTSVVDTSSVSLDADGSTTENLTYSTEIDDAGSQSVTVQSEDDSDSSTVTVEELGSDEASFALRNPFSGATYEEGNAVPFDVGVTADFTGNVSIIVSGDTVFEDEYTASDTGTTADYEYNDTFSPDTYTWYVQLVADDGTIHNSSEQGFSVVSSGSNDGSGSPGGSPSTSPSDDDDEEVLVRFDDTRFSVPYDTEVERSFAIENYGRESTTVTLQQDDDSPGCEYMEIQESVSGNGFGSSGEYTLRPATDVITDAYVERVDARIDMPDAETFADVADDGELRCRFEPTATNGGVEEMTIGVEPGRDIFMAINDWVEDRTTFVLFKERDQCLDVEASLDEDLDCAEDELLTHRWPTRFMWSVLFLLLLVAGGGWMVRRYY